MSRDASTLLLVHDAQQIHAGVGIQDPFTRPDVSLDARVGLSLIHISEPTRPY